MDRVFNLKNYKMLTLTITISLCLSNTLSAFSAPYKYPVWLQYLRSGQNTYKKRKYADSQKYYLGALRELEKLAQQNRKLKPIPGEMKWLIVFPKTIEKPFFHEVDTGNYIGMKGMKKATNHMSDINQALKGMMKGTTSLEEYNQKVKSAQGHADQWQKVFPKHNKEALKRANRLYQTYIKVLGKNSPATKQAELHYRKRLKMVNEDSQK